MSSNRGVEAFYRGNAARYENLVKALEFPPKPRISAGRHGPNMVVGARIRPLATDDPFPSAVFIRSLQRNTVDIHDLYNHPSGSPTLKSSNYEVDALYGPNSATKEIYDDLVADLVPFAWDGGIGTLFAYGQTGSGKTFTVSRLEELVAEALMSGDLEGHREITMSVIELAGNDAFDLLNQRSSVRLLQDAKGVTRIVGAQKLVVVDQQDMINVINEAAQHRSTKQTQKNDASSRSHAICRIHISNPATKSTGMLYLIDLAGSECARDVGQHNAALIRESRDINVSLSVLKECIRMKANADAILSSGSGKLPPRIPYRQSSLTRVLKHVFDLKETRSCRTVVIACVNPSLADVEPCKNTFRFAELLRVLYRTEEMDDPAAAQNWTNAQVRDWIKENSGAPPIFAHVLAPRETGAKMIDLTDTEFEYRCRNCPGVTAAQAKAFRLKLWQMY